MEHRGTLIGKPMTQIAENEPETLCNSKQKKPKEHPPQQTVHCEQRGCLRWHHKEPSRELYSKSRTQQLQFCANTIKYRFTVKLGIQAFVPSVISNTCDSDLKPAQQLAAAFLDEHQSLNVAAKSKPPAWIC